MTILVRARVGPRGEAWSGNELRFLLWNPGAALIRSAPGSKSILGRVGCYGPAWHAHSGPAAPTDFQLLSSSCHMPAFFSTPPSFGSLLLLVDRVYSVIVDSVLFLIIDPCPLYPFMSTCLIHAPPSLPLCKIIRFWITTHFYGDLLHRPGTSYRFLCANFHSFLLVNSN